MVLKSSSYRDPSRYGYILKSLANGGRTQTMKDIMLFLLVVKK